MDKYFERKLFPDIIDNKKISYDPTFIARRFSKFYKIYGEEIVDNHRVFQKAREMFTAAGFLYALSTFANIKHTLSPAYDESTPDVYGYYCVSHKKIKDSKKRIVMNIEITDWEKHSDETLSERILGKLKNKIYPSNYHLLVYVSKEGEKNKILEDISYLSKIDLNIKAIWALGSFRKNQKDEFRIVNIYNKSMKSGFYLELNINNFFNKKINPFDFSFSIKGRGKDFFSGIYPLAYPTLK